MQNYALCAVLTMYYEALCARSYVALCSPYFKDSSGSIDKTNSQYNPNSLVQYALYTLPQLSKMPKCLWRSSPFPLSQLSQYTSSHVSSSPDWKLAGQQQFSSGMKMFSQYLKLFRDLLPTTYLCAVYVWVVVQGSKGTTTEHGTVTVKIRSIINYQRNSSFDYISKFPLAPMGTLAPGLRHFRRF